MLVEAAVTLHQTLEKIQEAVGWQGSGIIEAASHKALEVIDLVERYSTAESGTRIIQKKSRHHSQ